MGQPITERSRFTFIRVALTMTTILPFPHGAQCGYGEFGSVIRHDRKGRCGLDIDLHVEQTGFTGFLSMGMRRRMSD